MNSSSIFARCNFRLRVNEISNFISNLKFNFQIQLPEDYLDYLQNYESFEGFINHQYVAFWDFDELIEVNEANFIFDLEPKTIGIGTNGGGELIALQNENNYWKVVLMPLIGLENPIEIGKSFSDFLDKLAHGEKWIK